MLYVDDGAFLFDDQEQLTLGAKLIFDHFKIIGMDMHIGRGGEIVQDIMRVLSSAGVLQKEAYLACIGERHAGCVGR